MELENSSTMKKRGPKGIRYPGLSLESAVGVVSEARKVGKSVSKGTIAEIGRSDAKGSTKSGAFMTKLAALVHYGLAEVNDSEVAFTPLADEIVLPKGDEEKRTAISRAFLSPQPFKELYEKLERNVPISRDLLGNVAVRDIGVSSPGRDTFLKNFINSGVYASVLSLNSEDGSVSILGRVEVQHGRGNEAEKIAEEVGEPAANSIGYLVVERKLSHGKAILKLPEEMTNEDIKRLKTLMDAYSDHN